MTAHPLCIEKLSMKMTESHLVTLSEKSVFIST